MDDAGRYRAALAALQELVAMDHELGTNDTEPPSLRVGVNSAMVEHAALVELLIDKGVFTKEEYIKTIANGMEAEIQRYHGRLAEVKREKLN